MGIPKIIHQIWSGIDEPLPDHFKAISKTWRRDYPDWQYEFWDNQRMNDFILKFYPEYWHAYNKFHYNVQRWDVIRYLILDKIGGMYVDFDYESIEPMNAIVGDKTCCFAIEYKYMDEEMGEYVNIHNNALMLSTPNHPYIKKIIKNAFSDENINYNPEPKSLCVLNTTGPIMLNKLYYGLDTKDREAIYLIPAKFVTPFSVEQANRFRAGDRCQELEDCLKDAYAVHYFFGAWLYSKI